MTDSTLPDVKRPDDVGSWTPARVIHLARASEVDFVVALVNRLPLYEEALDAVESLLVTQTLHCSHGGRVTHATEKGCDFTDPGPVCDCQQRYESARSILSKLGRGIEPVGGTDG